MWLCRERQSLARCGDAPRDAPNSGTGRYTGWSCGEGGYGQEGCKSPPAGLRRCSSELRRSTEALEWVVSTATSLGGLTSLKDKRFVSWDTYLTPDGAAGNCTPWRQGFGEGAGAARASPGRAVHQHAFAADHPKGAGSCYASQHPLPGRMGWESWRDQFILAGGGVRSRVTGREDQTSVKWMGLVHWKDNWGKI